LFKEMGFESGQELTARDGKKRLRRAVGGRCAKEPKVWREGFPEPWNEVMEAPKLRSDSLALEAGGWRSVRIEYDPTIKVVYSALLSTDRPTTLQSRADL